MFSFLATRAAVKQAVSFRRFFRVRARGRRDSWHLFWPQARCRKGLPTSIPHCPTSLAHAREEYDILTNPFPTFFGAEQPGPTQTLHNRAGSTNRLEIWHTLLHRVEVRFHDARTEQQGETLTQVAVLRRAVLPECSRKAAFPHESCAWPRP